MSEALKKMAEAMAAVESPWSDVPWADLPTSVQATFLRQARAGLLAIKILDVPEWIAEGAAWAAPGRMIDEILKEAP